MAVKIKPLRKFASGTPTTSDMVEGEIAVNTADKKIFMRDNANTIVEVGAASSLSLPISGGTLTDQLTTPSIRITGTTDVTTTSTAHGFQIGPDNSYNIRMDANEIQALNNGSASGIYLQIEGGFTSIGGQLYFGGATQEICYEGSTADGNETFIRAIDPTGDRVINFPDASGTISLITATETLTNKTLTTPVINGFSGTGNGALTGELTLTNTDSGSGAAILLSLDRDSSSPADWDYLGAIQFKGRNSADETIAYTGLYGRIQDVTDGTEDGKIDIYSYVNGTSTFTYSFGHDSLFLTNEQNIQWYLHGGTSFDITLEAATPTADRTITLPDASGTVLLQNSNSYVTITSTNAGSGSSPVLELDRDSASPADWDYLGAIQFKGRNDADESITYSGLYGRLADMTDGTEDGRIEIFQYHNGTSTWTYSFDVNYFYLINEQSIQWYQHGGTNYDVTLSAATPTADRTITLPDATGTVSLITATETLTNKTLTTPVINGFSGTGNGTITGDLTLISTDAGSGDDPSLILKRDSSSPADFDNLGNIDFVGENDASEAITYASISGMADDVTDGTEDGRIRFSTHKDGTHTDIIDVTNSGMVFRNEGTILWYQHNSSYNVTLQANTPGADRTITLPNASGTVVLDGASQTLTNKTLTTPVINGFSGTGNGALTGDLTLTSTDAGSTADPTLTLYRNSASPADNDYIGEMLFQGRNDNSQDVVYSRITTRAMDVSDTTEDGMMEFKVIQNGSEITPLTLRGGANTVFQTRPVLIGSTSSLLFEGSTNDDYEITIGVTDPTTDRTITLPDASGTVLLQDSNNDVTITSTDAGDAIDPSLILYRNSTSPAVNDDLGEILFRGRNDNSQDVEYAKIWAEIKDETDTTEDGSLWFSVMANGTLTNVMELKGNGKTFFYNKDVHLNTGVDLIFEGATANANETVLTVTDPTQDNTITLPDATGDVVLNESGTVNISSTANDGPILNLISNDHSDATDWHTEGQIKFSADNDADQQTEYASIRLSTADVTDGTEDGWLYFYNRYNGSMKSNAAFSAGGSFYLLSNAVNDPFIEWNKTGGTNYDVQLKTATPTADRTITLPDATGTVLTTGNSNTPTTTTSSGDADFVLVDDGGTMKKITPANLGVGTATSIAADNITTGDAAVTIATSSGDITIDAQEGDADIIFKGTDNTTDITALTLDMSAGGKAIFGGEGEFGKALIVDMPHSSAWTKPAQFLVNDMNATDNAQFTFGKALSAKNLVEFGYYHAGDGSADNLVSIGFYGSSVRYAQNHAGQVTIGGSNSSTAYMHEIFNVNGNIWTNGSIIFEGATADANETTLSVTDPTQDNTITLPDATGTVLTTGNSDSPTTTTNSNHADFVLIDDGGVMKKITPANLGVGSGGSAADDITTGDAAVTIATTTGDITIDAQGNDTDIIFKGTDNNADITALTLDMSEAGKAIFNAGGTFADDVTFTGANYNVVWDKSADSLRVNTEGKITLGTSDECYISHRDGGDGTVNTYIVNSTGDLLLTCNADDKDIVLSCDNGSGGVSNWIRLDGSTGELDITTPGAVDINASDNVTIDSVGGNLLVNGDTGNMTFTNTATNADITFTTNGSGVLKHNTNTVLTLGNSDAPTTTTSSGDADFVLVDDGGTMKKITPTNLGIGGGGGGISTGKAIAMAMVFG